MSSENTIRLTFPANMEYIPSVRKFFADCITATGFSRRFTFRSEIVIDELCNNAIRHGSQAVNEAITVYIELVDEKTITITVENSVAEEFSNKDLKEIIQSSNGKCGRGIKIIKILCDSIVVNSKENTSISVTRKIKG